MSDFTTVMTGVVNKDKKRLRKPEADEEEVRFLELVRQVKVSVVNGESVLVVTTEGKSFEEVFQHYTPAMKLYDKTGLIFIKTLDKLTTSDLEKNIVEIY